MKRIAFIVALAVACSQERPVAKQAAATQPKWMREEPKKTEPSPEVKALMKDDPDLKKQLTPAEVKMALAAAQYTEAPAPPAEYIGTAGEGEWSKMEKDSADKLAAYKRRMENTIVYAGPDGMYHTQSCTSLYSDAYDQRLGVMRKVFNGRNITLGTASSSQMPRHAECAAPSYAR